MDAISEMIPMGKQEINSMKEDRTPVNVTALERPNLER